MTSTVAKELAFATRRLGMTERTYYRAAKVGEAVVEKAAYDEAAHRFAEAIRAVVGQPLLDDAAKSATDEVVHPEIDIHNAIVAAMANEIRAVGAPWGWTSNENNVPPGIVDLNCLARAAMQYINPVIGRDNCVVCDGTRGGMPGNENLINGQRVCDYCHADQMTARNNGQKDPSQAALEELAAIVDPRIVGSKKVHVRVAALRRVVALARQAQAQTQNKTDVPEDVWKRVKGIIVNHIDGLSPDKVSPDASFIGDLGADSLDIVELTMAFEYEFDVEITDDEIEHVRTVQDATVLIARKM